VTIAYTKQKTSTDIKNQDTNRDTNKLTEIQRIILREIENNISKLKEIGLLERIGNNKSGYWKVV